MWWLWYIVKRLRIMTAAVGQWVVHTAPVTSNVWKQVWHERWDGRGEGLRGHYGSVKGMNWFGDVEDPISWMHIMLL